MALVPHGTSRFFVGKSCKQKIMPQEEIHELLITLAQKGNDIVRLKGGDPLLFGRGGEEALALAKHGISFEIIPGITSAHGCAAYAGIPLTHRGMATGVRFITGHREAALPPPPAGGRAREGAIGESLSDSPPPQPSPLQGEGAELHLNWPSLADPDTTLVVYMGLANLAAIAKKLIEHGLPTDFPAASIAHGTMPSQQVIISDLTHIAEATAAANLESPVLVIIGKVAALGRDLAWFQSQAIDNIDGYSKIFTQLSH